MTDQERFALSPRLLTEATVMISPVVLKSVSSAGRVEYLYITSHEESSTRNRCNLIKKKFVFWNTQLSHHNCFQKATDINWAINSDEHINNVTFLKEKKIEKPFDFLETILEVLEVRCFYFIIFLSFIIFFFKFQSG